MHVIYNQYSDNYDIKLLITEKSINIKCIKLLNCICILFFFLLHHIYKKIL